MASTSSHSSVPIPQKYDLFLSFRGEDTRYSFTDHLYKALHQAGIRTFRDEDAIPEGHELKPEIVRSITESRGSIIVFSKNFGNSSWCLDELWLILEQKRNADHFVLPVFYKVDPSDVRNQRGSYSIEAKEEVQGTKWTENNVERWKAALRHVANLKGMVVSGHETTFISKIVEKIYSELGLKLHSTPTGLTGIEPRAAHINSWLNNEKPDSPVLAICGMGGSGKTTLAEYIYNSNKQNFESSSLLKNIEKHHNGLLGAQKQLLRAISGNNIIISDEYDGALKLKKAMQMNKLLIVVDDIDDEETLSTLFGPRFHTQSKIIITTRLLSINNWYGSIASGCHVYKIELLNSPESLELLSLHAFGSKLPMNGFEELALQLAQYCGGNPLALKLLGSSLSEQGARQDMLIWRSKIDSLYSLKGDLDNNIQCVLHKSFESLPCDENKELFLHIACFFVGQYAHTVEKILEKDWHATYGIVTLINRCLITITRDTGKLAMHQLVQDMARKIVRQESKDPAKRSRVWHDVESYSLLRKGDGSDTIEGLALDMGNMEGRTSQAFKTSSLVKMKNLKLLKLRYVQFTGSYEGFPELIWLSWFGSDLKIVPPGLLSRFLVAIRMSHGDLEDFNPPTDLFSLKILDLAASHELVRICNIHRLPKLETLDLSNCTSLTHVCKAIGDLQNLSFLSLRGCSNLWMASSNQKFENQQPYFSLPKSLLQLDLADNPFTMLPSYIDLTMLQILCVCRCTNLKALPRLPVTLEELTFNWCSSLESITFQSAQFTLRVCHYAGCFKLTEIEGLFKFVPVAKLDEAELGHMQWIKVYQDHTVDLVGDVITIGKSWKLQMLYEYGIMSTYLQGITDQSMPAHEYTSSSEFLSFRVPSHQKKHKIKGLHVTVLYRCYLGEDRNAEPPPLFIRISNRSKGVTWVYSPVVYCKPIRADEEEDVVWLSYWPIGNKLDAGDQVQVDILAEEGTIRISGTGGSLVYMDDGEVEKEEEKSEEEVIGGDFEVTNGGYYLCRRDFFNSIIPDWLFGVNIQISDSRRWRRDSQTLPEVNHSQITYRNPHRNKIAVELGVSFNSESETEEMEKALSSVVGFESYCIHKDIGILHVFGRVDPQAVATCVREYEDIVQILRYRTIGH